LKLLFYINCADNLIRRVVNCPAPRYHKMYPRPFMWPRSLSTYQGRTALTRLRCYSLPDEVVLDIY